MTEIIVNELNVKSMKVDLRMNVENIEVMCISFTAHNPINIGDTEFEFVYEIKY